MSNNNVNLNIKVDDTDVKKSFTELSNGLSKLEKDAKDVEKASGKAFDTKEVNRYDKAVKDTNKALDNTTKELRQIDNQGKRTNKSLQSSFRKTGRAISRVRGGLTGLFTRSGIGIFLVALGGIIAGFGDFKNKALDSLGAVGDFIRNIIDGARDLLSVLTFGLIDSSATVVKELEKQGQEIIANQRKVSRQVLKLQTDLAIKRAKIAGAGNDELKRLNEAANQAQIDDTTATVFEIEKQIQDNFKRQQSIKNQLTTEENKTRRQELVNELNTEKTALLELEKQQLEALAAQADNEIAAIEEDKSIRKKAIEDRRKAKEIADNEAKAAADKELEKEKERLQKELELRLLFLVDQETAQRIRIQNEADAREKQANEIIKDADTLNAILIGIREKRDADIKALDDKLLQQQQDTNRKKLEDDFAAAQEALRLQQETAQAGLRETEAIKRQQLEAIESTENDIQAFEFETQKDREEQALRFEKERLELLLKFGALRTDAEKENIQALISALDAELNLLSTRTQQSLEDQPEGGFLANLLGLDPQQEQLVKEAIGRAIDNVNQLLDTRINALDTEIEAREKNLTRLDGILNAEQALLEAGEAANVRSTLDQLEQEEKARDEALKKQKKALIAKQTIDAVTQTSSLITASANIFSSLSPLGPIGVGIAIGTIALMFSSFAAAQAQAFSAIGSQKLNTGGRIMQGEKDTNGGRGLKVEGTNYVVGRGEWIMNANASDEHNDFLEAMNAGEFDGINLNKLMSKSTTKSINNSANKSKKEYNKKAQRLKTEMLKGVISNQTSVLHNDLIDLHNKPQIAATENYYIIRKDDKNGNSKTIKVNTK